MPGWSVQPLAANGADLANYQRRRRRKKLTHVRQGRVQVEVSGGLPYGVDVENGILPLALIDVHLNAARFRARRRHDRRQGVAQGSFAAWRRVERNEDIQRHPSRVTPPLPNDTPHAPGHAVLQPQSAPFGSGYKQFSVYPLDRLC
jgi:hypothetical protein